jgi:hypothetical protein
VASHTTDSRHAKPLDPFVWDAVLGLLAQKAIFSGLAFGFRLLLLFCYCLLIRFELRSTTKVAKSLQNMLFNVLLLPFNTFWASQHNKSCKISSKHAFQRLVHFLRSHLFNFSKDNSTVGLYVWASDFWLAKAR